MSFAGGGTNVKRSYRIQTTTGASSAFLEDEFASVNIVTETKTLSRAGQTVHHLADAYHSPVELGSAAAVYHNDLGYPVPFNHLAIRQRMGGIGDDPAGNGVPVAIMHFDLSWEVPHFNNSEEEAIATNSRQSQRTPEWGDMVQDRWHNVIDALVNKTVDYSQLVSEWVNDPYLSRKYAIVNHIHAIGAGPIGAARTGWMDKCLNFDGPLAQPVNWRGLPMFTRGIDSNMLANRNYQVIPGACRFTASKRCSVESLLANTPTVWDWADMAGWSQISAKPDSSPWSLTKPHDEYENTGAYQGKGIYLFVEWSDTDDCWIPSPVQAFTLPLVNSSDELVLRFGYHENAHIEVFPYEATGWMMSEAVKTDPFPLYRTPGITDINLKPQLSGGDALHVNLQVDGFHSTFSDVLNSTVLEDLYGRLGVNLVYNPLHFRNNDPGFSTSSMNVWPINYPITDGASLQAAGHDLISRSGAEVAISHIIDRATGMYRKFAFDTSSVGVKVNFPIFTDPYVLGMYGLQSNNELFRTDRGFFPLNIGLTNELPAMDFLMNCDGSTNTVGSSIRFTMSDGSLPTLNTPVTVARLYRDSDLTLSLYDGEARSDIPETLQNVEIHATDVSLSSAASFAPFLATNFWSVSPAGGLIGSGRTSRS